MSKKIILSLFLLLVFAFSGITYAAENPFKGLSQDQVIQKYFEGRQLDLIEGVWLDSDLRVWVSVKASLIDPNKKYGDYDYLMVEYSSSSNIYIDGLNKTQYTSCFQFKRGTYLRFLSRNSLFYSKNTISLYEALTRIYPSEVK